MSVTSIKQSRAPSEDVFLGLVQVRDPDIKMELLRAGWVRPLRRLMIFRLLKGQHHALVQVECRPAVTQRPPRVWLIQHAAEERLVKPGQFEDVGAIQHDTLQLENHEGQA